MPDKNIDIELERDAEIDYTLNLIKQEWLKNKELSLMQTLTRLGVVPLFPGTWYYRDDNEVVLDIHKNKIKPAT